MTWFFVFLFFFENFKMLLINEEREIEGEGPVMEREAPFAVRLGHRDRPTERKSYHSEDPMGAIQQIQ